MLREAPKPKEQSAPQDRRAFPRKRVLFSGVIADENGENLIDCFIRGLAASGAQVKAQRPLTLGALVYLMDTWNEAAHLATVVWTADRKAGLRFTHSYLLDVGLPAQFEFLKTLLIEAKLGQVRGLMSHGVSVKEAVRLVGMTERYLDQFSALARQDPKLRLLLHQARELLAN